MFTVHLLDTQYPWIMPAVNEFCDLGGRALNFVLSTYHTLFT